MPLKLFNPSRIGLIDQNYTIKEFTTKSTRRLKELNITDGVIIPEITGILQIKIIFNVLLTSLDFLFEGCTDLIKVNLSKINSSLITSMIYTFTDCSNLETVDMTSFNSSRVQKMEFLFGGCTNLENIKGFENLDTSSLEKTAGMFIGCENLQSVNLSSFQLNNISEPNGMFIDNPSLVTLDVGNTSDINGLLSSSENYQINIITTSNEVNTSGLSGQFTKLSRMAIYELNCTKRNWTDFFKKYGDEEELSKLYVLYSEYYSEIVNNSDNFRFEQEIYDYLKQIKYIDCNSPNNSLDYIMNVDYFYNFDYSNSSKCDKYKRFFIDLLNEFEKCTDCQTEKERRVYCKICSKGYYVPKGIDFEPKKCRRCDEGCIDCIPDDETDQSICLKCEDATNNKTGEEYDHKNKYMLYDGKCIKKCSVGYEEKCQSCNEENGKYDQCLTCNYGYYFDENYDSSKCKRIEIEYCSEAVIESGTVRCTNCSNGYIVHDNKCVKACNFSYEGDGCASCNQTYEFRENCASCNSGYYLAPFGNKTICKYCNENFFNSTSDYCKECEYFSGEVKCTECNSDFVLVNGRCINSCSGNCQNCTNENGKHLCNKCIDGYFLKEYGDGKICEGCSKGCQICSNENSCTECKPGYKLVSSKPTTAWSSILTTDPTKKNTNEIFKSTMITSTNLSNIIILYPFTNWNEFQYKVESNITKNIVIPRKLENNITTKTILITSPNINSTMSQKTSLRKLDTYYSTIKSTILSTFISDKESYCVISCNIGYYEKCKTCDLNEIDKCEDCNPGYYLPNDTIYK